MSVLTDPLKLSRHQRVLDCGCDICNLGPLPGERRADWLRRLTARFAAHPLPELKPGPQRQPVPIRAQPAADALVDCERCGEPRWVGRACQACRTATRLRRALA